MTDILDDLVQTPATPAEAPMTLEELNALRDRILRVKRGEAGVTAPTREELKRAYDSLRHLRAGATSKAAATKKAASTPIDLDSLFGPPTEA